MLVVDHRVAVLRGDILQDMSLLAIALGFPLPVLSRRNPGSHAGCQYPANLVWTGMKVDSVAMRSLSRIKTDLVCSTLD
jgi:hypothetical protein